MKVSVVAAIAWAVLSLGAPGAEARFTAVQTFYVPLPEDQISAALSAIFPGTAVCGLASGREVQDPIISYVSIAPAADGTVLIYDHWEDGYEADISRPVQATTAIWGDGDAANGSAPGLVSDLVGAGEILVLHNSVAAGSRREVLDFDGGDKIAVSIPVAVSRAAWASGTSTLFAGAVEVYDTREWGHAFRAPVGENVPGTQMFEHAALLIMAAHDGTRVDIDADADGAVERSITLDEGESSHVPGGVLAGASVTASAPIQVDLVTGDVCATFQSRWFTLVPAHRWSGSYYAPVSTSPDHRTTLYAFNPGPATISLVNETRSGREPGAAIPPGGVRAFEVPDGSGAHLFSEDGGTFLAVAAVDVGASGHEWGFALVPEHLLTPQALVGWGAGRDVLSIVNPDENGSPVWVTPVPSPGAAGPVAVCVDYDGDNDGALVDAFGSRYDRLLSLEGLQRERVFDPDGDQTGMILYVCDGGAARLAVAWGQDPEFGNPNGAPAIDLGTTVPPLPSLAATKDVELAVDADGDGRPGPGDTLRYLIAIRNISRRAIEELSVSDELPAHTTYVAASALLDNGGTERPVPDAGSTPFPLDEGGSPLGTLPVGGIITLSFLVVVDNPLPAGVDTVVNQAVIRSSAGETVVQVPLLLAVREHRPAIAVVKTAEVSVSGAGTGTQGFWKNHPEAWPLTELSVGGVTLSREQALEIMGTPGRGDKTYDLFRQLAAGLLNVINGAEAGCVEGTISDAEAWMAQHPPGAAVNAGNPAWRDEGAALHTALDDYNNGRLCAPHRDTAGGTTRTTAVTFTIAVTNTGNVPLADVSLLDPAMPACDATIGVLAPGASATSTCAAAGVLGDLTNVAVASGFAPDGGRVEARGEVFVDIPGAGAAGGGPGARPARRWQARPADWPVLELTLGGRNYSRRLVLRIMRDCRKGDTACALFTQLAAARLNLLQGLDASCVEQPVAAAEAWLAAHPLKSRASAGPAASRAGGRLSTLLSRYNRGLLCAAAAPR